MNCYNFNGAELAARLAEIEAQQPSMYVLRITAAEVRHALGL